MEEGNKEKNPIREYELNTITTKFLSEVSHEFKTPISGILSSISLIEKYAKTSQLDKIQKHISNIKGEVEKLDLSIDEFIDLERVFQDKIKYQSTHFKLNAVISDILEKLDIQLKLNQQINYKKDFDDIDILQDTKVVEYIFFTVFQKVIKYSPENKTITILAKQKKDAVVFYILNEKETINDKTNAMLDESSSSETVLVDRNGGIGLKMVQNHLKRLGGHIGYLSDGEEKMSFKIVLPINNL